MKNWEGRFGKEEIINQGEILKFENLENKRIYNPSRPFLIGDKLYLVCRVEDKVTNLSQSLLFEKIGNTWFLVKEAPVFNLEDPFLTEIQGKILFGGVYVGWKNKNKVSFLKTVFYYARSFFELDPASPFTEGPLNMKDIRIVDLKNGKLGVFTRPQGGRFVRGRICYLELNSLEELKNLKQIHEKAREINLPLKNNEWVGTNDVYLLDEEHLGVLIHYAYKDQEKKLHYFALTFIFQPKKFSVKNLKIIAQRRNFPNGPAKHPNLKDVVFPGGIINEGEKSFLYCGLSDNQIGVIQIKNPFII